MSPLSKSTATTNESQQTYHILLVDGDLDIHVMLMVLLKADFRVSTARTVSEGFHYLNIYLPSLVILDCASSHLEGLCFIRTLRQRLPDCPVIVITTAEPSPLLQEIAAFSINGLYQKPFQIDKLLNQIHDLFASLGQSLSLPPRLNRHISKAIEYMGEHYAEPLTVTAVAETIGMSSSHLSHLFLDTTGMTVRQYLTEVRLEVVKRVLIHTDHTLDNIAERIGFCDASHLSRVFRRHVGYYPGEYRRRSMTVGVGGGALSTYWG